MYLIFSYIILFKNSYHYNSQGKSKLLSDSRKCNLDYKRMSTTDAMLSVPETILVEIETDSLDIDYSAEEYQKFRDLSLTASEPDSHSIDLSLLSHYGATLITDWQERFKTTGNLEAIMEQYSDLMEGSRIFKCFSEPVPEIADAALHLLEIIDIIVASRPVDHVAHASISAREADIIEFIGGFVLRRVKTRFLRSPQLHDIISNLESDSPQFTLIPLLENTKLIYPSMEVQSFFQNIFVEASREFSKPAAEINVEH